MTKEPPDQSCQASYSTKCQRDNFIPIRSLDITVMVVVIGDIVLSVVISKLIIATINRHIIEFTQAISLRL